MNQSKNKNKERAYMFWGHYTFLCIDLKIFKIYFFPNKKNDTYLEFLFEDFIVRSIFKAIITWVNKYSANFEIKYIILINCLLYHSRNMNFWKFNLIVM